MGWRMGVRMIVNGNEKRNGMDWSICAVYMCCGHNNVHLCIMSLIASASS